MHRILVVDDEEAIRKNIERLLSLEGYEVATAPNGQHGLVIARSMLPDIIITDINMPGMDGFAMLDAIRHHPELDRAIVIMLTAADERDSMRRGMRLGADDYLTKPFRREELLDAINSQLKKLARFNREKDNAVAKATALTEEKTREHFREQFAGSSFPASQFSGYTPDGSSGFGVSLPPESSSTQTLQATVMFADIRNFTTMAERLSAAELAALLGRYFELACRPVVAFGGTHLKMLGDGLLALFEEDAQPQEDALSHAQRALAASVGIQDAVGSFKQWVQEQYGQRGLPSFSVGIGLHSGEVTLSRLGGMDSPEVTALGDSVNIASRLQAAGKELGWLVVASIDTAQLAGECLRHGRQELVSLRGREKPVAACEVLGISAVPSLQQTHPPFKYDPASLQAAAVQNSEMTARAAKEALKESLWSLQSGSFQSMQQSFRGYQIIRKLGEGGMSDVYLAFSAAQKSEVVLKVLRTSLSNDAEMLRRFIQEYAVLANLTHHHVSRIYDQGFTDDYAYIAMEYLSGGTLKEEIRGRGTPGNSFTGSPAQVHGRVIDLLRQITSALNAIHKLGLVYRDLKPDNLMFRSEGGELVLVDFGIVKNVGEHTVGLMPERLVSTEHGQVIGTPYYVSPEQATGQEVTHRSDFYSLGVMLYEMLTGSRPYKGDSLNELLARHLHAEIPRLPPEHAIFQMLLDSLMAKQAIDRPADAMGIWRGLDILANKTGSLPKARID
ncbi:response regulator [Variovorax sp. PCZ-1]|uniref:protein kinase domain-containing protein n=1 Tax=Variovorax sp. PCZ-1 TaxID=2835533 RepID=UPI001BCF1FF0|nr:response regulator [Variovorax sp. PCZ-1]MBS7807102.1 response regulator [Variovorax sp. PCZ-1]